MTPPMADIRFCFNCGAELPASAYHDRLDTCGSLECEREAQNQALADREDAHEQLDRDNGWGRW